MKRIALVLALTLGLLATGGQAPAATNDGGAGGYCGCSANHIFGRGCQVSGPCPCVCHCPFIGGCGCSCGSGGYDNPVGD